MQLEKKKTNVFAGLGFNDDEDSDDLAMKVNQTKTQKKKVERQISEKVKVGPKPSAAKLAEGGFDVTTKGRAPAQAPQRGGGEGRGRGGRGGRGGEGRGRGGADRGRGGADGVQRRPRTAAPRLDADGNPIKQKEHKPFTGKAREDAHPFDKKSGTGRGRRPFDKKEGHGKFNTGDKEHVAYKKKGDDGEEVAVEEVKEAKVEAPVPEPEMEIIGYSMDEFMAGKKMVGKKESRAAEGVKGAKVQANDSVKVHQETVQQNKYAKDTLATTTDVNNNLMGFG